VLREDEGRKLSISAVAVMFIASSAFCSLPSVVTDDLQLLPVGVFLEFEIWSLAVTRHRALIPSMVAIVT
jgi:hypothetical protein